ncbi:NF-kappa-B inhibitor zeta [Alligator mississippiensis]|uniref:NF-kappa-B inhibitor zeta n=1 Tax=Alligator mississippiensis TaxID=8496 RepID=UPI0009071E8A|nr:NF-kappa-B inhibitor zeta [Alligator mississippiensis]
MLQTAQMRPGLLAKQNISENEILAYSTGQGSPLPGETASPRSCFQTPCLPDSGLTEFNVASPKIAPLSSGKQQKMSALTDPGLSADPPQRQYVGVRVRLPVRELLRKIRLSKGMDPNDTKDEQQTKVTKGCPGRCSGRAEKRRAHPYTDKQLRQSKNCSGKARKALEDLDILVEVLEEDLNRSQSKLESPSPQPACFTVFPDLPSAWWEAEGSTSLAGSPPESCQDLTKFQPCQLFPSCNALLNRQAENYYEDDYTKMQPPRSLEVPLSNPSKEEISWQMQATLAKYSQRNFQELSGQDRHFCHNLPGQRPEKIVGTSPNSLDRVAHLKSTLGALSWQDLSTVSFFQFQLQREENLLRNIPVDKLLAPDENGNRLLHKAVTQGKRALAYALARKYACLNKIDEKDAAKRTALHLAVEKNQHLMASDLISLGANINEQDSLGKTPLHLCAENGYLRVLEVLRNYKARGLQVEVNAPDHYGLTPLHCAAHAHTILMVESQRNNITTDARRFLKLRRDQILEGISCLLQMGADRGLQILKSYQTATSYLKAQENHELMLFLQSHSHMRQDFSQEGCSLPSSPRGMIFPDLPEEVSELLPTLNACSQMFDKKGKCC